jgi:hypothetical protein
MSNAANNPTTSPEPYVLQIHIGSTSFRVGIHFNATAKESLNEKNLRLLKNELQSSSENVTMNPLQADWLSERSSV